MVRGRSQRQRPPRLPAPPRLHLLAALAAIPHQPRSLFRARDRARARDGDEDGDGDRDRDRDSDRDRARARDRDRHRVG